MEKIYELLKKLGIELTADQKKQLGEVAEPVRIGDIGSSAQAHRVYSV